MIYFIFLHKIKKKKKKKKKKKLISPLSISKERLGGGGGGGGVREVHPYLKSLLRLFNGRSTQHYTSKSKNELMNDTTLIM